MGAFVRSIISVLILACSCWSAHAAAQKGMLDRCGAYFHSSDWTVTQDDEVERYAKEFLATAGVTATPVVCSGIASDDDPVQSIRASSGFVSYFYIGIRSDFRLAIGEEIRAVIAHEVAHLVTDTDVSCGSFLERRDEGGYIECEHRADQRADTLAGRGQMARTLRWLIGYLRERYGADDRRIGVQLFQLNRRIYLLH